jgi:phosphoribosyl 1,2-cyclic phosphodiesterase
MPVRYSVLASGSSGNASFLEVDGFGVLVDAGLGPRRIAARLAAVGAKWSGVRAVLLTHTHGDHWNRRVLRHLRQGGIPLYCYSGHEEDLSRYGREFPRLRDMRLVRSYGDREAWELGPGVRCRALRLRHDGGDTFGFRFDGRGWSMGYVSDLGSWTAALARALAGVDLLCLEFNHDVDMEVTSGRSPALIARVLGAEGHLSNEQAAGLLREVVRLSPRERLRHLVQLHLSRECNRPTLAVRSAMAGLSRSGRTVRIHTACQDQAGPVVILQPRAPVATQQWLPGWESESLAIAPVGAV